MRSKSGSRINLRFPCYQSAMAGERVTRIAFKQSMVFGDDISQLMRNVSVGSGKLLAQAS